MSKKSSNQEVNDHGLSAEFWSRMASEHRDMYGVIRPMRRASYTVDYRIGYLDEALRSLAEGQESVGGRLDLNPDFQRGHVWSRDKQIAYVENVLRGTAPTLLRFNCPCYGSNTTPGDLPPNDLVCVDGLQRITALLSFLNGDFKVFDKYAAPDLKGTPFDLSRYTVQFSVFEIRNRKDLLTFYLDINSGGVVHSDEELARVRALRDEA